MRVRHQYLRQSCAGERLFNAIEMPGVSGAGVDERRHASRQEPRPVAVAGHRAGIEGVHGDRVSYGS